MTPVKPASDSLCRLPPYLNTTWLPSSDTSESTERTASSGAPAVVWLTSTMSPVVRSQRSTTDTVSGGCPVVNRFDANDVKTT